jgi:hypothetical protein
MSKLFDDEFMDDAIGVAVLLVAVMFGVSFGAMVVIAAFNWFELIRGLVQ